MNIASWKQIFFAIITCGFITSPVLHASRGRSGGRGGAIAAGILGGAALGAAAASASDGYYGSTCWCDSPYGPPYPCPCYYGYPAYANGYPYGPGW